MRLASQTRIMLGSWPLVGEVEANRRERRPKVRQPQPSWQRGLPANMRGRTLKRCVFPDRLSDVQILDLRAGRSS
jgi:hypothetical protein